MWDTVRKIDRFSFNNGRLDKRHSSLWQDLIIKGKEWFEKEVKENRAIAGFVVYDVTDQYSFQNAARWLEEIQAHSNEEMIIALVGNKADQEGLIEGFGRGINE